MKTNRHKAPMIFMLFAVLLASGFNAALNAQVPSIEIRGVVKDERGALIVAANVTVTREGEVHHETQSDALGQFRFTGLKSGAHVLTVRATGFAESQQTLNLSNREPETLSIILYPTVKETVTVGDNPEQVAMDPERAAGTMVLKEVDIAALPDDPDELYDRLQLLATSAGGMPGGATVTVDGFFSHGRLPPKGSIREIRINPDLYSAEYDKAPYRGGRIEILTKPGTEAFHGSSFFNFNDGALNARNAFALTKPASSTRRYGFDLGGPILKKKTGFLINFERRDIDEASTVNALVLDDTFRPVALSQNSLAPARLTVLAGRFDWQANIRNTFTARYDFNDNRLQNQGIGGFNLPDRGFNTNTVEHTLRFTENAVLGTTKVNEARVGITSIHIAEQASSNAAAILVPGAFSTGGANAQSQSSDDLHLEIADNFSLVVGKHKLKLGVEIFGKISNDTRKDNFNGTYIFGGGLAPQLDTNDQIVSGPVVSISGLEQYRRTLLRLPGGLPTRFAITTGNPAVRVNQWLFSAFAQDEWKFRRRVALSLGLRYEGQTNPTDRFSLGPRFGIAYSADKKQHWILRAHIGLFYTRIPDSLAFDVTRLNGQREQQVLINNPSFPNPFVNGGVSAATPTIKTLQPGITPEASWQAQLALEHQLSKGWKLNVSQSYSIGRSALRSVNINAPILIGAGNPLTAPRPFGLNENVVQYQSTGSTRGGVTFVGANHAASRRFNIFCGYLFFHLRSNADTPTTLPQSSFNQSGEWARPFWQSTHRAFVAGIVFLPWKLRASPTLNASSGTPFNITTGIDNNGDGSFTDRPSLATANTAGAILTPFGALTPLVINGTLPRNFGTNPATITMELDLARDFALGNSKAAKDGRYKLTLNVRASNLLNRVNVTGLNGVLTSPFFDRANSAGQARKIEFGARFTF